MKKYTPYYIIALLVVAVAYYYVAAQDARARADMSRTEAEIQTSVEAKKAELVRATHERELVAASVDALVKQQTELKAKYTKMFSDLEWARKEFNKITKPKIVESLKDKTVEELADKFKLYGIQADVVVIE